MRFIRSKSARARSNPTIHSAIASHIGGQTAARDPSAMGKLSSVRMPAAACTAPSSVAVDVRNFLIGKGADESLHALLCPDSRVGHRARGSYRVLRNRRIILHDRQGVSSQTSGRGLVHSPGAFGISAPQGHRQCALAHQAVRHRHAHVGCCRAECQASPRPVLLVFPAFRAQLHSLRHREDSLGPCIAECRAPGRTAEAAELRLDEYPNKLL